MRHSPFRRTIGQAVLLASALLGATQTAHSQTPPPAWDYAKYFKYNVENVVVNTTAPGSWNVKVIFSVSNPVAGGYWLIKTDAPYTGTGANLSIDIGWDPGSDISNTGAVNAALAPVVGTALGTAPAAPITLRNLNSATTGANACDAITCPGIVETTGRFWVQRTVTPVTFRKAVTMGRVVIEGRPVCSGLVGCPPGPPYANIPVKSEAADFAFVNSATPVSAKVDDQRRKVVDFDTKCAKCHNGIKLDGAGVPIPRLTLHGNNRNENPKVCVVCHNANQTDVAYRQVTADPRTSSAEVSVDFKRMVHSIHAGGFRKTPYVVVGFNTSINDFSGVRFPAKLSNCLNCHVEVNGKGSFELPLPSSVLGSTVVTGSTFAVPAGATRTIDVNPANDLKISPTAATCSGCHDSTEVQRHMTRTGGASFGTLQQNIGVTVNERCASCHGPGKEEDVRKAHEIRSSSRGSAASRDD